jgi:hypothetical protein
VLGRCSKGAQNKFGGIKIFGLRHETLLFMGFPQLEIEKSYDFSTFMSLPLLCASENASSAPPGEALRPSAVYNLEDNSIEALRRAYKRFKMCSN